MIKQIQLRGISRTPSDRMSADGGCSESLNVNLMEGEVAPAIFPDNVTSRYAIGDLSGPALFIHKGYGYECLIFLDIVDGDPVTANVSAYSTVREGETAETHQPELLFSLETDEEVKDVSSIGNTLIVCTDRRMMYVLHKDGHYICLGDHIPIPDVEFRTERFKVDGLPLAVFIDGTTRSKELIGAYTPIVPHDGISIPSGSGTRRADDIYDPEHHPSSSYHGNAYSYIQKSNYDGIQGWASGTWRRFLDGESTAVEEYAGSFGELNTTLWDMVKEQMHKINNQGYFCTPVFARYALRLYDNTYIYQSVPVLIGAGDDKFFTARGKVHYDGSHSKSYIEANVENAYKVKAYLKEYVFDGWEDIVQSIDIFLSTDIHNPQLNAQISGVCENLQMTDTDNKYYDLYFDSLDEDVSVGRIRDEVLSKSNFYLVATFGAGKTEDLVNGYDLMTNKSISSQDYLVTQKRLPDGYETFHQKRTDNVYAYNNKIIMAGFTQVIYPGYPYMNGSVIRWGEGAGGTTLNTDETTYRLKFYLRDSSSDSLSVVTRNDEGGKDLSDYSEARSWAADYQSPMVERVCRSEAYAWIAYPDARCYRVDVSVTRNGQTIYRTYDMVPHPNLACSYLFLGLDTKIGDNLSGGTMLAEWNEDEHTLSREPNDIWASRMDNPFLFPAEGKKSFVSEVVGIAAATLALSEGQFGQFPLYVFTKEGIWSQDVTSTGEFGTCHALSRDVALSKKSIQPIDQAVVFVTARGVMLLQRSSISCISKSMMGPHYTMSEELMGILNESNFFRSLIAVESSPMTFSTFLADCTIAYDYRNSRLFFKSSEWAYLFVYQLDTQTWHKFSLAPIILTSIVNAFPDCYLCTCLRGYMRTEYKLYNLSTQYDAALEQYSPKGIIVTRPFDLDEPDVRKAIRSIRIRGAFHRENVRYILLGSFDGHNWKRLTSLRGGSYKMFRIVLLTQLNPNERISWIDVDYETRFAGRLR